MINRERRELLQAALAGSALSLFGLPLTARAGSALTLGPAQAFSFDALKARARAMASAPHVPPPRPAPEITAKIDYATHGQIKYRPEMALAAEGPGVFR